METETEIEMVQRHIRVGEAILARERSVIMRLSARGLPRGSENLDLFEPHDVNPP